MANEINFKPKFRISLLDTNGAVLSDRLVDSYPELTTGPKQTHTGPTRIEITLTSKQDVDNFKEYLDRLQGSLPLREVGTRGRPSTGGTGKDIESPREEILMNVENLVKEGKNQTQIMKYLRDLGFVFLLTEDFLRYFPDFDFNKKDVGTPNDNGQYPKSLSWMARCVKRGKDPKTDKFDPMIIFGFSILEGPSKKVVPYLYRERKKPLRIALGKKGITPNSVEFTKFPPYMQEEERLKFSADQRAMVLNPEKQPTKLILRWANEVKVPYSIWEKLKDRVPKLKHLPQD